MSEHLAVILLAASNVILVAVLAALVAGCLARRAGAGYPAAVTRAAVAFVTTLTLASLITSTLTPLVG
ncbi:hypothetical protein OHS33_32780 [Streptomyces sp. NBC_00536]|uniref:hypothetical protein n=1 Tax=Streptomyces sp. NBC_00536 TaxID=2975769 RepID=UPI002E81AFE5|nr:hypothetical protein [Streptomyces sp. NBC_00536]WUC82719.1 hypothetical protein OHS33_32780 [Streptomyces sp. NBC_00536]